MFAFLWLYFLSLLSALFPLFFFFSVVDHLDGPLALWDHSLILLFPFPPTVYEDTHHSNNSCCPLQSLQITKELVPQGGIFWSYFLPDSPGSYIHLEMAIPVGWAKSTIGGAGGGGDKH